MSGLRSNRSWKLLLTGGTVSSVGDYVFDTTMVLWIGTVIAKGQSWAPAAVSGVLLSAAIPAIFVGRPPGCSWTGGTSGASCWSATPAGRC